MTAGKKEQHERYTEGREGGKPGQKGDAGDHFITKMLAQGSYSWTSHPLPLTEILGRL